MFFANNVAGAKHVLKCISVLIYQGMFIKNVSMNCIRMQKYRYNCRYFVLKIIRNRPGGIRNFQNEIIRLQSFNGYATEK